MKRIDERDTMFARMSYRKGTWQYDDYYSKNKDKKEIDDTIREKPNICGPGTATYSPVNSPIADANFLFLNDIKKFSEGKVNPNKVDVDKKEMTKKLKGLTLHYGAALVGICSMKDYHYYSYRGRHSEVYGEKVDSNKHRLGIVFAVEMDKEMLNRSPQLSEVIETSNIYVKAAMIGMQLSYYIRLLGYDARNHMDANFLAVLPLVARDAGIGEIGRNGILTTKKYGSRVRLGLVTTEMELIPDSPTEFGLQRFCEVCGLCSDTCPGKAIPKGDKTLIDGDLRWQITQEKCYGTWRNIGTDCGICISSCPYSQGVKKSIENDDDIDEVLKEHEEKYGARPYIREAPEWLK
ncbi:MAG: 4Fe-4S dicluster domain-containing protein [Firmicutes bacterium]|nr:4Fe-4S dicluster domain-containing protein [Bacillota bacterium]